MVVAIAALLVAIAGTAVAGVGTISVLNKKEKKQVRKLARQIANQRITQRAANLTVKNAASADSAKVADTAKAADAASVAGNVSNQLWAVVDSEGALSRSSPGIVKSEWNSAGQYFVTADRNLSACFYVASLGGVTPGAAYLGVVSASPSHADPKTIFVGTHNLNGDPNDFPFTLLIRC
jgi:hypothetical protein